jgi:DNA mismatch endonuclease (patch repair protein)
VIFVDGDFWHARLLREAGMESFPTLIRTPRKEYWFNKFKRRIERDDEVSASLRKDGWLVLRFWESDLERDLESCAKSALQAIKKRRQLPPLGSAKSLNRKADH